MVLNFHTVQIGRLEHLQLAVDFFTILFTNDLSMSDLFHQKKRGISNDFSLAILSWMVKLI